MTTRFAKVSEVADRFRVSADAVYPWIRQGKIPSDCVVRIAGFVDRSATKTGACAIACWRSRSPSRNVSAAGGAPASLCPASCAASVPARRSRRPSTSSIWMASTAAAWAGGKASAPPLSSAISAAGSSANSPSGIHRAAHGFWASTSTSSPDARATPPPCVT